MHRRVVSETYNFNTPYLRAGWRSLADMLTCEHDVPHGNIQQLGEGS